MSGCRPATCSAAVASGSASSGVAGPSSSRHVSSIEVRLDVMAKPVSLARSGMRTTRELALSLCVRPSSPSGSQVRTRCQMPSTRSSASCVVARLSGLLPERPKETIRVGVFGSR
jgi:hypothetical protein